MHRSESMVKEYVRLNTLSTCGGMSRETTTFYKKLAADLAAMQEEAPLQRGAGVAEMQNLFCTAPVCHHDNPWFQEFESQWCTSRHPPGFQGGVCTKAVRGYRECWQVCLSDNNLYTDILLTHDTFALYLHYIQGSGHACLRCTLFVISVLLKKKNETCRLSG